MKIRNSNGASPLDLAHMYPKKDEIVSLFLQQKEVVTNDLGAPPLEEKEKEKEKVKEKEKEKEKDLMLLKAERDEKVA